MQTLLILFFFLWEKGSSPPPHFLWRATRLGLIHHVRCDDVAARSGLLEEEQVRGRGLGRVVGGRSRLDVLAAAAKDDAVGGARVDAREIDVGVDGAEHQAEKAQHQDGDDAARYQRLVHPVGLVPAAGCRRRRLADFRFRS